MNLRLLVAILLLVGLGPPAFTQESVPIYEAPGSIRFNVNGAPADDDLVVVLVDLTNTTLTLAAQPDVCRVLAAVVVDTTPSITDGDITFTGTACDGTALVEVEDASAGAGTYTTTGAFATVTSIVTSAFVVLGGSSDETIKIGTTATIGRDSAWGVALRGRGGTFSTSPYDAAPGDLIETSGSSATVTEVTASSNPFEGLKAGDVLVVSNSGARPTYRVIDTWTDAGEVVVDEAVDWSAQVEFSYYVIDAGSGAQDGWVDVGGCRNTSVTVQLAQYTGDTNGVDWWVECREGPGEPLPTQIYPDNEAGAAVRNFLLANREGRTRLDINSRYDSCRVRVFHNTLDDATDTGTAREEFNTDWTCYPQGQ